MAANGKAEQPQHIPQNESPRPQGVRSVACHLGLLNDSDKSLSEDTRHAPRSHGTQARRCRSHVNGSAFLWRTNTIDKSTHDGNGQSRRRRSSLRAGHQTSVEHLPGKAPPFPCRNNHSCKKKKRFSFPGPPTVSPLTSHANTIVEASFTGYNVFYLHVTPAGTSPNTRHCMGDESEAPKDNR